MALTRDITIKVQNDVATLDGNLYVFEDDHGVTINFLIKEYKYKYDKDPENILNSNPEDVLIAYTTVVNPLGYEIDHWNGEVIGEVVRFRITKSMTDELTEIGIYQLQIHILCEHSEISIPPISFEVKERLKGVNHSEPAIISLAEVDLTKVKENEPGFTYIEDSLAIIWNRGDIITAEKLNQMVQYINNHAVKGDKGDTGEVGPMGPVGPVGPQGEQGEPFKYEDFTYEQLEALRGPQGLKGDKGDKGDKGEKGDQGPRGFEGEKGDRGFTGLTGPTGPVGPQGEKGERGEKGDKGDPFEYEDFSYDQLEALRGPQGIQGIQGIQGEPFRYEDFTEEQLLGLVGPPVNIVYDGVEYSGEQGTIKLPFTSRTHELSYDQDHVIKLPVEKYLTIDLGHERDFRIELPDNFEGDDYAEIHLFLTPYADNGSIELPSGIYHTIPSEIREGIKYEFIFTSIRDSDGGRRIWTIGCIEYNNEI